MPAFRLRLTSRLFYYIIRPWLRTLQWIGIVDKINVADENNVWLNDIIQHSEKLIAKLLLGRIVAIL